MGEFLRHKKAKGLMLGVGLMLLAFVGIWLGILPKDDPETEINETYAALAALGGGSILSGLFIIGQSYSDGRSGGMTATKAGPAILLIFTLGLVGCAAPDGVLKAHADAGQSVQSLANQHAALVKGLGISDAKKLELLEEAEVDFDAYAAYHARMGEYLDATDVFDMEDATQWIAIGLELKAAVGGGD